MVKIDNEFVCCFSFKIDVANWYFNSNDETSSFFTYMKTRRAFPAEQVIEAFTMPIMGYISFSKKNEEFTAQEIEERKKFVKETFQSLYGNVWDKNGALKEKRKIEVNLLELKLKA